MGNVVQPYIYNNGQVIDANQLDSNLSTLYSLVNGNLDGSNLKAGLNFDSNGIINAKSPAYNASGSALATTGSITSGSFILTLTAALDFVNGQGISIAGAGVSGATLVTSIANGAGTTQLTLNTAASTTVVSAAVGHDDTVAIRNAIAACKSVGSGRVVFPVGTYNISSKVTVPSKVKLRGFGESSWLVWTGTATTAMFENENFATTYNSGTADYDINISNLRITALGTTLGSSNVAINFGNVKRFNIHHNYVENSYSANININACSDFFVDANYVAGGNATSASNGITVDSASFNFEITRNHVHDAYDCGIGVHNASYDFVVDDNTIVNTTIGSGVDIAGALRGSVTNNRILNAYAHGVIVHDNLGSYVCNNIKVLGNTITLPQTGDGIHIVGDTVLVSLINANDNTITIGSATGNGVQVSKNAYDINTNDNTVKGAVATTIGVLFSQNVTFPTYCNANNNIFDSCLDGVALQSLATNINVLGNTYKNCTTRISASNVQYASCNLEWAAEKPTDVAFQNSWVNYGSVVQTVQYWKDKFGMVHIHGGMKSGTITAGTLIFQLPVGYRPLNYQKFVVDDNNVFGTIEINNAADGAVRVSLLANNTSVILGHISFLQGG